MQHSEYLMSVTQGTCIKPIENNRWFWKSVIKIIPLRAPLEYVQNMREHTQIDTHKHMKHPGTIHTGFGMHIEIPWIWNQNF